LEGEEARITKTDGHQDPSIFLLYPHNPGLLFVMAYEFKSVTQSIEFLLKIACMATIILCSSANSIYLS